MLCCACTCVWSQRARQTHFWGLVKIKTEINFNHTCWKVCSSVHPLVKCIGKMYLWKIWDLQKCPCIQVIHPSVGQKQWQLQAVAECREELPSRWPWSNRSAVPRSLTSGERAGHTDTFLCIPLIRFPGIFSNIHFIFYIFQYRHFTMALGLRVIMQMNYMLPHWYLSVMSVKKKKKKRKLVSAKKKRQKSKLTWFKRAFSTDVEAGFDYHKGINTHLIITDHIFSM